MNAEAIIIGDEILYGLVREENSKIIIDTLNRFGIYLSKIQIIRDDEKQIIHALREAFDSGNKIVITTGGLGPTNDDKTLDAIAKFLNKDIIFDDTLISKIKNCFKNNPPKAAFKMARIIDGAKLYESPLGLVPGQLIKVNDSFLIVLPGPPSEVKALLVRIISDLIPLLGFRHRCKMTIYLNTKEAEIADLLIDVMEKFNVYVKVILTERSDKGLPIEILSFSENRKKCLEEVKTAADYISKSLQNTLHR